MTRVSALLAIYGLLFLILGDLLDGKQIGWSAICLITADILITLAICRLLIERWRARL